ncbi:methyltransferase domain-containing protein [Candidatus Pacearchaeota archaeon]|nr:methyltransferase domain-containing protein [Candidatus Pacearchaeota archaeon]
MVMMTKCKICNTNNLVEFISFGEMPVANAFLKQEELSKSEFKYEMKVGFCEYCHMVQLINIVPYDKYIVPDEQGKTNYAFFSSTSKAMEQHFAEVAKEIEERFLDHNSKVLEIGSNDGIFLKAFKKNKVLGIEPSQNVAEIAKMQGIETITEFFSTNLAQRIVYEKGRFKAIFSANVILNIIDLHDLLNGVNYLLEDSGVFIFEVPYIVDILEKTSYDQIYDEHIWYFSLTSLRNLMEMHGLELFDAERQETHGGSMRVYVAKKGKRGKSQRLIQYLEEEKQKGVDKTQSYLDFAKRVEESKTELVKLLKELKGQGKKIVGYAAASKGTIVLNYCNIGTETLDYISDSTPFKQGLYSPGKHIPIVSPEFFHDDENVDYVLLGAWNHAKEIMAKEQDFIKRGGKFIVHYPKARILENNSSKINFVNNLVEVKKLNVFANDQGYLFETIRSDDKIYEGKYGQTLISVLYPGVIKGWHLHDKGHPNSKYGGQESYFG